MNIQDPGLTSVKQISCPGDRDFVPRLHRKKSNSMEDLSVGKLRQCAKQEVDRWSATPRVNPSPSHENVFTLTHPPNVPAQRRPRLGQSSLVPHLSVLPVSCTKTDVSNSNAHAALAKAKSASRTPNPAVKKKREATRSVADDNLTNTGTGSSAIRREQTTKRGARNDQSWMVELDDNPVYGETEDVVNNNEEEGAGSAARVLKHTASTESDDSAIAPPMPPRNYRDASIKRAEAYIILMLFNNKCHGTQVIVIESGRIALHAF